MRIRRGPLTCLPLVSSPPPKRADIWMLPAFILKFPTQGNDDGSCGTLETKRSQRKPSAQPNLSVCAEARIKAFEFRKNLALGILPKKKITFGEIADEVVASKTHLRPSTASQMVTWRRHCDPIADRHIGSLTVDDCTDLLAPLYASVPRVADRVRALMADVFSAAKVRGHFSGDNPCVWKDCLDQILPRRPPAREPPGA